MDNNKVICRRPVAEDAETLIPDLHPVIDRIYRARKVQQKNELNHSLDRLLLPSTLLGLDTAVDLLEQAIKGKQRILIVADYDADGATSCALAVRALRQLQAKGVCYLVPNRFEYGYGLTPEIVALAAEQKPDLIITVDNGIASIDGVKAAQELGIRILITDHHLPGEELPVADAIVNPNQKGDDFASKNLAGVGVIFYVMLALRARLRENGWFQQQAIEEPNYAQLLDLVALGTVADLVPLDYNNRILVAQGLQRINKGQCCSGIQALLKVANRQQRPLTTNDLAFFVAPRLNAAGRLDDMALGIDCLLSDDLQQAHRIAIELDGLNHERRNIQSDMQQQAQSILRAMRLEESELPKGLCLFDKTWHQGIVGLVASKIKEKVHRPVIAFAPGAVGELKGSARSISGLHIRDTLDRIATKHPALLQKFGGHAMAAGLSIRHQDLEAFRKAFIDEVDSLLDDEAMQHKIWTDGELQDNELQLDFAKALQSAGPWGQGFPEPMFDGRFIIKDKRIVGDKHIKLRLQTESGTQTVDAIAFHATEDGQLPAWQSIHAAYRLDVNEFRGNRSLQLIVEYIEPIAEPITM